MVEQKDLHLSFPVRTAKLQLAIDRRMLEPTKKKKKDTPYPGTKEKPLQDSRRGTIMLKSNPLPAG